MSRDMWYEFYYENIKKLCALAHSYGLTVMMHSCGSIGNIIDDLISAGVDIIDPVQISAREMEPENLAARFGGRVVFHGGIDTQHVLPRGNEKSVQDHVDWTAAEFSRAGGYIACGSQLYGPDIPTENIIRVYTRLSGRSL